MLSSFLQQELLLLCQESKKHVPIKEASERLLYLLRQSREEHHALPTTLSTSPLTLTPFLLSLQTRIPRLISISLGCIHKLVLHSALPKSQLETLLEALEAVEGDGEVRLKVVVILYPFFTNYSDWVVGGVLERVLGVVAGERGGGVATLRQIVVAVFERLVESLDPNTLTTCPGTLDTTLTTFRGTLDPTLTSLKSVVDPTLTSLKSVEDSTLTSSKSMVEVYEGDVRHLFHHLTLQLHSSTSLLPPLPLPVTLELLEAILESTPTLFNRYSYLQNQVSTDIVPYLVKCLETRNVEFPVFVRLVRNAFQVLLLGNKGDNQTLYDCLLGLLKGGVDWHCILILESLRFYILPSEALYERYPLVYGELLDFIEDSVHEGEGVLGAECCVRRLLIEQLERLEVGVWPDGYLTYLCIGCIEHFVASLSTPPASAKVVGRMRSQSTDQLHAPPPLFQSQSQPSLSKVDILVVIEIASNPILVRVLSYFVEEREMEIGLYRRVVGMLVSLVVGAGGLGVFGVRDRGVNCLSDLLVRDLKREEREAVLKGLGLVVEGLVKVLDSKTWFVLLQNLPPLPANLPTAALVEVLKTLVRLSIEKEKAIYIVKFGQVVLSNIERVKSVYDVVGALLVNLCHGAGRSTALVVLGDVVVSVLDGCKCTCKTSKVCLELMVWDTLSTLMVLDTNTITTTSPITSTTATNNTMNNAMNNTMNNTVNNTVNNTMNNAMNNTMNNAMNNTVNNTMNNTMNGGGSLLTEVRKSTLLTLYRLLTLHGHHLSHYLSLLTLLQPLLQYKQTFNIHEIIVTDFLSFLDGMGVKMLVDGLVVCVGGDMQRAGGDELNACLRGVGLIWTICDYLVRLRADLSSVPLEIEIVDTLQKDPSTGFELETFVPLGTPKEKKEESIVPLGTPKEKKEKDVEAETFREEKKEKETREGGGVEPGVKEGKLLRYAPHASLHDLSQLTLTTLHSIDTLWLHLLSQLSHLSLHPHPAIRTTSSQTLFRSVLMGGSSFQDDAWELFVEFILFPLVESTMTSCKTYPINGTVEGVEWEESRVVMITNLHKVFVEYGAVLEGLEGYKGYRARVAAFVVEGCREGGKVGLMSLKSVADLSLWCNVASVILTDSSVSLKEKQTLIGIEPVTLVSLQNDSSTGLEPVTSVPLGTPKEKKEEGIEPVTLLTPKEKKEEKEKEEEGMIVREEEEKLIVGSYNTLFITQLISTFNTIGSSLEESIELLFQLSLYHPLMNTKGDYRDDRSTLSIPCQTLLNTLSKSSDEALVVKVLIRAIKTPYLHFPHTTEQPKKLTYMHFQKLSLALLQQLVNPSNLTKVLQGVFEIVQHGWFEVAFIQKLLQSSITCVESVQGGDEMVCIYKTLLALFTTYLTSSNDLKDVVGVVQSDLIPFLSTEGVPLVFLDTLIRTLTTLDQRSPSLDMLFNLINDTKNDNIGEKAKEVIFSHLVQSATLLFNKYIHLQTTSDGTNLNKYTTDVLYHLDRLESIKVIIHTSVKDVEWYQFRRNGFWVLVYKELVWMLDVGEGEVKKAARRALECVGTLFVTAT